MLTSVFFNKYDANRKICLYGLLVAIYEKNRSIFCQLTAYFP